MNIELTRGELPIWLELFKAALTGQSMQDLPPRQIVINAVETANLAFAEWKRWS